MLRPSGEQSQRESRRPVSSRTALDLRAARKAVTLAIMIEEEEERSEDTTAAGMAEAIEAIKSASPSLGQALGSTGMTPEKLADAHQRATGEGHNPQSESG